MSAVRGWCPGALQPMPSGDGLVLRIRPPLSQLTPVQALMLADLAEAKGTGALDLTSRGNLQMRGIPPEALPEIHAALAGAALLDPNPKIEARRNILTTPRRFDPLVERLSGALALALVEWRGPRLPAKFGFAVDCDPGGPLLTESSADIRLEAGCEGLILRADGAALGLAVSPEEAVAKALALAEWFAASGGIGADGRGRMAAHVARLPEAFAGNAAPLPPAPTLRPGEDPDGMVLGLAFGQCSAKGLRWLAARVSAPIRLLPGRMLLAPGLTETPPPGFLTDPEDPLLRVNACTGAPGCASASVETRALARRLAPLLAPGESLHVSGCAKGCASARPARFTLTGRGGRFDLITRGRADAPPARFGLLPETLPDLIRGPLAP